MQSNDSQARKIIEQAQFLLEQEKNISPTFRAVLSMLFALFQILLDGLRSGDHVAESVRLKEELTAARQQLFGNSSDVKSQNLVPDSSSNNNANIPQLISVSGHTRRKQKTKGRNIDTSVLPRYKVYHDLNHEQRWCNCCNTELKKLELNQISEQLELIPKLLYVVEHIRFQYGCSNCKTLVIAPKPAAPLPKALAGGSLIADVIINKYQYHLPLYRQSKIFSSLNIELPDNTLGNWVMQSGAQLDELMAEPLWQAAIKAKYLQVDESPVKVQSTNKKGFLWAYLAPYVGNGLIVFEFSLTREGAVAEQRLSKFKGLIQTDGYSGYNNIRKRKDITGLGCLTHARRKFSDVIKITQSTVGVANEFIERVRPLYVLEEKMRSLELGFHTRKRLRQKQAFPALKSLYLWLKQQQRQVPPRSKLGNAITYTMSQWKYITAYLRHGMAEIDTNWVENEIRPSAIGKRNWLFMSNADSGKTNAFWYSLVQSALINGLNPRIYIHYLLMNIHNLRKKNISAHEVLPHTIDKNKLAAFAEEQNVIVKQVLNSS